MMVVFSFLVMLCWSGIDAVMASFSLVSPYHPDRTTVVSKSDVSHRNTRPNNHDEESVYDVMIDARNISTPDGIVLTNATNIEFIVM
jgi:hypothetical protein